VHTIYRSRIVPDDLGRRMTHDMLRTKSIHQILDQEFRLRVFRLRARSALR
jgi:GntR family transcriptional regulator